MPLKISASAQIEENKENDQVFVVDLSQLSCANKAEDLEYEVLDSDSSDSYIRLDQTFSSSEIISYDPNIA